MTSSPRNIRLGYWRFSPDIDFPNSYKAYAALLSKEYNRYSQDTQNNTINLKYVFDTAINESGFGNTVIDVENSKSTRKIEKATVFSDINEVVLVNKLKDGKKGLIGLFRGSCSGGAKSGLSNINFSLFKKNSKCTPNDISPVQIAFFPSEYFAEFKRKKGITDSILSTIFSEYSDSNLLLNYIFYTGSVDTNNESIYRHGTGSMLRKLPYGGYEIIGGTWGGGREVTDDNYSDDFVFPADAFRISESGNEKIEGIAIGGKWYNGRYYDGTCLSWRLNFGSDVVFNYTGTLRGARPMEWGIFTFNEITYLENKSIKTAIMTETIKSLVVRSFTVPISKPETATATKTDTETDTGINIHFVNGDIRTPKYLYVGNFIQNNFSDTGHGVEIFFDGEIKYIYLGSSGSDFKHGILYTLTPRPTTSTVSDNSSACANYDIKTEYGKFGTSAINKSSKAFGFGDDDYYKKTAGSSKEGDKTIAILSAKAAVDNFTIIKARCDEELKKHDEKIRTKLGVDAIRNHDYSELNTREKCVHDEYNKIEEYRGTVSAMFKLVERDINYLRECDNLLGSVGSPAASPAASPMASPMTSPMASPMASPAASPAASPTASPTASTTGYYAASPMATPISQGKELFASLFNLKNGNIDTPNSLSYLGRSFSRPLVQQMQPQTQQMQPQTQLMQMPSKTPPITRDSFGSSLALQQLGRNVKSRRIAQYIPYMDSLQQKQQQQQQQLFSRADSSSAFQGQQQSFMQPSQQPSNQQQSQYYPLQQQPFAMGSQPDSRVSLYQSSPIDQLKYREKKQLVKEQEQQLTQLQAQLQAQQQAQQQAQFQAQLQAQQAQLQAQLENAFKQNRKQLKQKEKLEQQEKIKQLEAQLKQIQEQQSQASSQTSLPSTYIPPSSEQRGSPLSEQQVKKPQVEQSQQVKQPQVEEPQVSQPHVEEKIKPGILFISKCVRRGADIFMNENGFIALGQQFLGYGSTEEKAIDRAITGKYEKKDQGKIPGDYYVIDVINDKVGVRLDKSDVTVKIAIPGYNGLTIGYEKDGVRKAQQFNFIVQGQSSTLKALIEDIQTKHVANVQSEEAKSNMKQRLTKCLGVITKNNDLLQELTTAATDTNSGNVMFTGKTLGFINLNAQISYTIQKIKNLITNLNPSPSSSTANLTTEQDVENAESDVDKILDTVDIYMRNIIKEVQSLPAATHGKIDNLAISIAKEKSSRISLQHKKGAEARGAEVNSTPPVSVPTKTPPPPPPSHPPPTVVIKIQEMKKILEKKLDEMDYEMSVLTQLNNLKETFPDFNVLFENINKNNDEIKKYQILLQGLISTLKSNYNDAMERNVQKTIRDTDSILSSARILKDSIIAAIENISETDSSNPAIGYAKKAVAQIKEGDKEYQEMSTDGSMTEMVAVVEEAKDVFIKAQALAKETENVKDFYVDNTGVAQDNLNDALSKNQELEQLIKTIDDCDTKAQELSSKVTPFEKLNKFKANKSVEQVEMLKAKTYSYAAEYLAILVKNMSTSATNAINHTTTIGAEIKDSVISTASSSQQQQVTGEENFKAKKEIFDKANEGYTSIYDTLSTFISTSEQYLKKVPDTVRSIKDKTEVEDVLKKAKEAYKLAENGRKKLVSDYSKVLKLTTEIKELQIYLDDVDKKFGEIEKLKKEAATLLSELEKAKDEGIVFFETYDSLTSSSASGSGTTANVTADDRDTTKTKANIAFGHVSGLNSEIKKKISEAKVIADEIVNGAKFEFIKTKAQQQATELDLSTNTTAKDADSKFNQLETKRNDVYKIGDINFLKQKSTELQTNMNKMKSFVDVITRLGKEFEGVNAEVGNTNDTELMSTDDSTLTKINGLKSDSEAKLKKIVENKSDADTALSEITNLDSDINTLFRNLENNPPPDFSTKKDSLEKLVKESKESLAQATLDVTSIVAVHQKALDENRRTTEMATLYGDIKEKYDGALKLLIEFKIDEKIKSEAKIRSETEAKIDQKLQQAEKVSNDVMDFSDGKVLTSEQVKSIEQKYKEVEDIKTELAAMQAGNSGKEVKFTETVVKDVLEKLDEAISHIKSISTSVSSYAHLSAYSSTVLSKLETKKDMTESKKIKINKEQSDALTSKIQTAIDTANQYITAMSERIDKLKVLHTTHTCNTVGSKFTFSRDTLSGHDNEKIKISGGGKTATQIQKSYIKCLWLTTEQGIPTDCTVPVTWAIKITTSDVKNLKDMLMGVGIGEFNPFAKTGIKGIKDIKDCDVIPGFWGFSGAKTYIDGVEYNESNSLNIDYIVFFTLSPVAVAVSSSSSETSTYKKFNLYMVCGNYRSNKIELTVPDSTNNLYPIVRFKSNGDKYTFMDVDSNLSLLKTLGNFSAAALKDAGFTDEQLKAAGFSADELNAVKIARGFTIPPLPPPRRLVNEVIAPAPAADAPVPAPPAAPAPPAPALAPAPADAKAAAEAKAAADAPPVNIDDAVLSGWYITKNSNNIMFMVYYRGNDKYDVSLYGWSASLNKVVGSGYFFTISTYEFKNFQKNINDNSGTAHTMTINLNGKHTQIPGKWQKNNPGNSSAERNKVSYSRATKYKKEDVDKITGRLNTLLKENNNIKYGWIPYYVDKKDTGFIETMATKEYETFDDVSKINMECYNAGIRVSEYGVTRETRDKDSTKQKFRVWVIPELVEVDEEKKILEENKQAADADTSIIYYLSDIVKNPSYYEHYKDYIKENFPLYDDTTIDHMTILLARRRAERLITGLAEDPTHNALLDTLVKKIKKYIDPQNILFIQRLKDIFGDGTVKHGSDDAILEYTLKETFDAKGDVDKHIVSIISKLLSLQTLSEKLLEKLSEDIHGKIVYNKKADNKWYITIMDPLVVLNKLKVLDLLNASSTSDVSFPNPALAPVPATATAPAPAPATVLAAVPVPATVPAAVPHNLTVSSDKGFLSGFKSLLTGIKKGGKSGSSITRKRRLRLKKSRNITRHKGGKKSVRFSARVKLNNGTGKGNGNGTSSMNKRTRKVSSSSYKLSARRVIKLKR